MLLYIKNIKSEKNQLINDNRLLLLFIILYKYYSVFYSYFVY
jgi:hypothetical protein